MQVASSDLDKESSSWNYDQRQCRLRSVDFGVKG